MARRYGNAGNVSSLISSARSAYEKTQALQDQIYSLEFDNSAKTAEDADKYKAYLASRAKTYEQTDPMKYNTMMQKVVTTNRSFVSAETGRLSNQVIEGNMSNTQKYQQLGAFYQQAMQNGDENLAQRLYGTLDRLSVTIQNEQTAANNAATAASNKAAAAYKSGVSKDIQYADAGIKALIRQKERGEITDKEFYQGIKTKQPDGSYTHIGGYGELVALKDTLLGQAANDPKLDEETRYTYDQKRQEFQANGDFKQATDAGLNVAKYANNIDPQYAEYDKNNNLQYRDKNVVGGLPGLGNLYNIPNLADSGNLAKGASGRRALLSKTSASGDKQEVALNAYLSSDNPLLASYGKFYYAKDPTTGELYFVDDQGNAKEKIDLNKPTEIAKNGAKFVDAASKGSGFFGGIGNALNSALGINESKRRLLGQVAQEGEIQKKIASFGFKDLVDKSSGMGTAQGGAFGGYYSGRIKQLQDTLALAEQRKAIADATARSNQGYAGLPKAVPSLPQSITPQNTVKNTIGPRLPTPQLKKDAAVIGSPQFVDKYNLGNAYKLR